MTEKNEQAVAGLASDLNRELDVIDDGMMCVWVDDTEISHYLGAHINDSGNMEAWQESLCVQGSIVIDNLRHEVKKLRNALRDVRSVAAQYYQDACGECEEAGSILKIIDSI